MLNNMLSFTLFWTFCNIGRLVIGSFVALGVLFWAFCFGHFVTLGVLLLGVLYPLPFRSFFKNLKRVIFLFKAIMKLKLIFTKKFKLFKLAVATNLCQVRDHNFCYKNLLFHYLVFSNKRNCFLLKTKVNYD